MKRNAGQVIIEYILLLVVAATIAAIIVKGLASRDENSPGMVVKKWIEIQTEIGNDLPDQCTGNDCNTP